MFAAVTLISALGCGPHAITLHDAEGLVLASPAIRAAVVERHARPFFEYVEPHSGGWYFVVKARGSCSGPGPCSNLLGHYSVSRRTAEVTDMDEGEDGTLVTSLQLAAARRNLLRSRCG
jgi:hypothetical protein